MNFEKVSAEEQKQLEAKYSGKNLFPSKPEEGEEYTDGRIEDGTGGFSYPPEYTDGRVQDGEGGFAYPPEEPQNETEQVTLDDVLKDRKTFEFYYKNGYFDMKGDIMPLLKDTLWNLVADTGYGLSTIPEGTIASFSGDKKKSAQALATRYQMYGDLEADWKTIWHGIFRAGNIAKQKIFDGENSEDDIDSSYEFWTNYNRLEKERLVAVADRVKNDFFTYGIDPEIKDLIESGKVTPDFRASRGLTNVFDPTNVGLFGAGAKAGMRGATELFQGAQRGLVKDTQKLMLKQNSIKQAIRTGTSATGRGAFGKSSSKELLEESKVISTQIGENLGKIKEMNKYRQQEMLNFVQNLERSHPLRKLIESNLKGIPVKGQRSALGVSGGLVAYGGGKLIENLGNTIRFVQTLPEEIATNYFMRTFKMSEEKASAMSKSIGTLATPLAVGAGGYALVDEFTDNELLAWAGASLSLLPFFRRFGRDVAIMGREAMQPTTELSILQRIGSLGDESLAEIAIDRTKVMPFKSTFGAVAGTSDDTLKGIGRRISSGAGQKLSSKPMQMGVEALNRSGLGRYVESAGRVADQGFKGALMGGAFGIAGNPESPEGFLSGAVGGSAFAVTGYAFGKGIQKGTQLMGFNNTNEVIRARHGSHQYYVKHLLPEGEKNAFMALPKDIQIAYANASMSYPHTTFNYINGGKEGKGGRQYRVDDDYFIEVNVDSDWAIEPLMRHEISHYLEQVGGTRSFDDILIGNHITDSVGIFTKRDEKGNPIKTFDKDGRATGYEVTDDFKEYKYLYGRFNFPDALNAEAKWNDIQKKGMEDSDLGQEIKEKFERHKKQVIDAVHDHVISREIVAEHGADYFLSDPRRYKDLRAGTVGLLMRRLVETPVLNNQPFLRNFIAKLGGTFRGDGLLESPNSLFAKTKRIPAITELLRKYNRQIEGVSKDKINKRFEIPDEAEGKVVLDVKGADFAKNPELVEVLRSGTLMRLDKDGNIVPSQAMAPKEIRDYNKRFTEALSQAINQTEMEEGLPQGHIKERTTETGEKVFEGRYIDDKVIDRIEKMGGWNKSQIETLRNISRALKNKKNDKGGNDWLISYFKATTKGGGKYVNARVQNGVHIPYGLYMSKKGNIIVRTISLEQYIKNFDKALRQRKKEVIGLFGADDTRNAFMEASHIYHSNHAEGIHGSVGLDSDPVRAKEKADFLNAMFGATSKEHRGKNPWLEDVEGTKQDPRATYRSLRLERIGRADQLSGKRHVDPRKIFDNFMPQKPKDSSNPYRRDRVPALQGLADGLQDGSVTPEEYAQGVDENLPVQPLTEKDIIPATPTELRKAISEQKASKVKLPKLNKRNALKTGDKSALRLDIPSYDEFGVYVPTIYDGNGKTVSHQSTAVITDATFGNKKSTALNVAKGGAKSPFATIKGKYKKVTEKEAVRLAQEALKNEDGTWTQVGLDPERHSYFYDRLNHRNALTSADEVVQVGRAVFAKNAKKDSPVDAFGEDAYYMPPVPESKRTSEEFINRAIKKSSALEQMIDSLAIDRGVDPKELPLDELLSEAQFVLDTFSEGDHVNKSKGEANKIRNLIKNFGGTSGDTFGLPPLPNFMPKAPDTPEFKRFFRNSKVVDENGNPLPVWHGSENKFFAFDSKRKGSSSGAKDSQNVFYFSDSKLTAEEYMGVEYRYSDSDAKNLKLLDKEHKNLEKQIAEIKSKSADILEGHRATAQLQDRSRAILKQMIAIDDKAKPVKSGSLHNTYLSIQSPLRYDMKGEAYNEAIQTKVIKEAMELGHDGVIFENMMDSPDQYITSNIYAVFKPTQIKSVDNKGTFDPSNPDIRYMPQKAEGVDGIRVKHEDVIQLDSTNLEYFMPAKGVNLEDYADRKMFALAADRLGVGQMSTGPIGAKKVMDVDAQGGRGFMYIFNQGGWAFKEKGTANSFLKRVKEVAGEDESVLVGITVLADLNHLNSPFGQLAYANALQATIDSGAIPKKRVDQHIREIAEKIHNAKRTKDDDAVWKEDDKKVLSGEHVAGEFKNRWKKGDFTFPDKIRNKLLNIKDVASYTAEVKKKQITFDVAGKLVAKAKNKQLPIPADEAKELGIDPFGIASDIVDKGLEGLPMGDVVALLEVPVKQDPQNTKFHYSYPWTIQGKAIGFLNRPKYLGDLTNSKKIYNKKGNLTAQPIQTVMPVFDKLNPDLYMPQHSDMRFHSEVDGFKDNIRGQVFPKIKQDKFSPSQLMAKIKETKGAMEMAEDIDLESFLEGKKSVSKLELSEYISEKAPYLELIDVADHSDTGHTKWSAYKEEGMHSNYSEYLLRLPDDSEFEGTDKNPNAMAHWEDDRVLAHARTTERYLENGDKTYHIEEVQSDWHQYAREELDDGDRRGYASPTDSSKLGRLKKKLNVAKETFLNAEKKFFESKFPDFKKRFWTEEKKKKLFELDAWIAKEKLKGDPKRTEEVIRANKLYYLEAFSEYRKDSYDDIASGLEFMQRDLNTIWGATPREIWNKGEGYKILKDLMVYKNGVDQFIKGMFRDKETNTKLEKKNFLEAERAYDEMANSDFEKQSDAPFKNSWRHRMLSELVKDAIGKGYKYLSWTTGQRSSEMNRLDRHFDSVLVRKTRSNQTIDGVELPPTPDVSEKNKYSIVARQRNGQSMRKSLSEKELTQMVGKEYASKAIEKLDKGQYSADDFVELNDIKLPHEGRRNSYDVMLPKTAERIGKFIGSRKPIKGKIMITPDSGNYSILGKKQEVWVMELPEDYVGVVENIPLYMPNIGKELPASASAGSITNNLYFKSDILAPEGAGTRVGELNTEDQEDSFYFKN